ncbi:hypothetical protein KIL84_018360, partial [Mauremys mutica]
AHLAPLSCFKAVNTEGDRCGNCGGDGLTYNKCEEKDVLCGRLQCVNVKKIPQMKSLGSIVQTPVDDILCWGTEFHAGRDMVDVGSVGDGTTCGENKICINRTCVNIEILDYDCNYTKCSNRGTCNSKKNCHCNFGWAPPDCTLKGFGGSVDSGPPPTASSFSETLKLSYSEVIVPRKLEPRDGIDTKEKVSYLIKVEGKFHIVHLLQKKMFIAPNIPVFTYNEKGDLITDYPYIQDDCYYSGYVEDVPESVAVLSTCSGLWGYFMIYDLNYEIEPVKSSSTFQHVIYRMAADEDSPDRCGVTDEDMEDQVAKDREHQISKVQMERQLVVDKGELNTLYTSTRYLECYFVADKAKFRHEDSNETLLTLKMLQYVHLTSEMYRPFGLHVVLIALELWTERDLMTITHLLEQVIVIYSTYVRKFLMGRVQFDHTELIVGGKYPGIDGYSYGDNLCTGTPSVATVKAISKSVLYDAISVAHEMGHSLGMPHDNSKRNTARGCVCKCPGGGKCVMWSYAS